MVPFVPSAHDGAAATVDSAPSAVRADDVRALRRRARVPPLDPCARGALLAAVRRMQADVDHPTPARQGQERQAPHRDRCVLLFLRNERKRG